MDVKPFWANQRIIEAEILSVRCPSIRSPGRKMAFPAVMTSLKLEGLRSKRLKASASKDFISKSLFKSLSIRASSFEFGQNGRWTGQRSANVELACKSL